MPRWIKKEAGKGSRLKRAKADHDALVARHAAERSARAVFRAEQEAEMQARPKPPRRLRPGTRQLPDLSDAELADALSRADPIEPRHLAYPHLLILRSRGYIRSVLGDDPHGRFAVPVHRGDVTTSEGLQWLKQMGRA